MTDETRGPEEGDPEAWMGRKVGPYTVVRLLGTGGVAFVFLALADKGRRVALKVLRPELSESVVLRLRFEREAAASQRIDHENVLRVETLGHLETGSPYFATELLVGMDLADTLAVRRALSAPHAVRMGIGICAGLTAAHEAGVIHRDIKPENIFLVQAKGGREIPKILDFGFAWIEGDAKAAAQRLTERRAAVGTPEYMAPEQIEGLPGHPSSDIYSLGIVLYETICGRVPFEGGTYGALLRRHIEEPPRPLSERANVSSALHQAIMRSIAKKAEDRFPSARAFGEALKATPESASNA